MAVGPMPSPAVRAEAAAWLARLHAERGDLDEATALLAQADDLAPAVSHLMSDNDRIDRDPAWSLAAASPLRPGS